MKPVKLLLLFVSIFCFYSCESAMNKSEQSEIDIESDEMRISESSVDAVLSFVKDVYPQKYKILSVTKEALKIEYVTNVSYEKNKFFAPSADNASRELDTLLCVINFGNNEGFAIISTQDNQILAVTESGDLSIEDLTIEYTNDNFENNPKAVISNYVANYMSSLPTIPVGPIGPIGPTIPPGGPVVPDDSIDMGYAINGPWEIESQVNPLVQMKIGQRYPYNMYCPKIGNQYCLAGCAAIAVIQIMSANKYPNTIGGRTYDWNTIIDEYKMYASAQDILAYWIRIIGDGCKINYGLKGSGTKIDSVIECFSLYSRYKNVNKINNPNFEDVHSMLQNGTPLYFRGSRTDSIGELKGHAWVVDGYINKRQLIKLYDSNMTFIEEFYQYQRYVHCNWGWQGECDGYYVMNIFDLKYGASIPDESEPTTRDWHYNQYIQAIVYNLE